MAFADMDTAAAAAQMDAFGVAVTYTPQGAQATSISAIVEPEQSEVIDTGDTSIRFASSVALILVSDVTTPKITGDTGVGDTIAVNGTTFWVKDILEHGGRLGLAMHRLKIESTPGRPPA